MHVAPAGTLITEDEILQMLQSGYIYERKRVFILEPNGYKTDLEDKPLIEYARSVREAYANGKTIVVKGLESFNQRIFDYCKWLGEGVDAHMYLSPKNGTSFGYHQDDTDVIVQKVYGKKKFQINRDGYVLDYETSELHGLFIRQGEYHQTLPEDKSCIISFGIPTNIPMPTGWKL